MDDPIVVAGAGLAGLRAVEELRTAGHTGPVTVVGGEAHLPYDRPPLSKQVLRGAPVDLALCEAYPELGATWRLGVTATALDTDRRRIVLSDGTTLPYHGLIVATGSRPRPLPGRRDLAGVHCLRTVEDGHAVRRALRGRPRMAVIGGGFIGAEVASAARELDLAVTLVEAAAAPLLGALGPRVADLFTALHAEHGVTLRCGTAVRGLRGETHVTGVDLADGTTVPAELVVVGIGVVPNTEWLTGSGLRTGDGVHCDRHLSAGPPGVYAAGDVARAPHPLFGPIRVEHWTTAAGQARLAARNLLAELAGTPQRRAAFTEIPYFWSEQHGHRIQVAGWAPGADEVRVDHGPRGLPVALFGRAGTLVAAMTWDAPRELARWRRAIAAGTPWLEAVGETVAR